MMAQGPWVRVVIVNYNSGAWLQKVIDGLAAQTLANFEVVIVDNNSTDQSIGSLSIPDSRFKVLALPDNLGFAAANNIGFKGAQTEWLAALNPDCVPEPEWLERVAEARRTYPDADMFGSTQLMADDPDVIDGFGDFVSIYGIPWRALHGRSARELPDKDVTAFSPCAAAAFYRREAYEKVGGFCEDFFCYLEDIDLGWRLQRQGSRCVQLRKAVVLHKGSLITVPNSAFSLFHSQRNRVWMVLRNMPSWLAVPALLMGALLYVPILLFRYDREGRLAALRGAWEGLRTPAPMEGVDRAHPWRDVRKLMARGLMTINPWVFSRKGLPFVRDAGG